MDLVFITLNEAVIEEGILDTKTDGSGKDLLFFAYIAFWVITFEPIMI